MATSIRRIKLPSLGRSTDGSTGIHGGPTLTRLSIDPGEPLARPLWMKEELCTSATGDQSVYTLKRVPISGTNNLMIYINGLLQRVDTDYTVDGKIITFAFNVDSGSNIIAFYEYNYR